MNEGVYTPSSLIFHCHLVILKVSNHTIHFSQGAMVKEGHLQSKRHWFYPSSLPNVCCLSPRVAGKNLEPVDQAVFDIGKLVERTKQLTLAILGRCWSTVVDHLPRKWEIVGLIPTGCWAFSPSIRSNVSSNRSEKEASAALLFFL